MGLYHIYYNSSDSGRPYPDEEAYRRDLFAYVDMCLTVAVSYRMQDEKGRRSYGLSPEVRAGVAVTQEEALRGLDFEGKRWEEQTEQDGIRRELLLAKSHIMGRLVFTPGQGGGFRLVKLRQKFQLTDLEYFMLLLALTVYRDAKYETLLETLQGQGKKAPTLRLAFSLYEMTGRISQEEKGRLLQRNGSFFQYLAEEDQERGGASTSRMFALLNRAYTFLLGERSLPPELKRFATRYEWAETLEPVSIRKEDLCAVQRFMQKYSREPEGPCRVLHMYGEAGNGRRFLVRHGAKACGLGVITVDLCGLSSMTAQEMGMLFRLLRLESKLTDCVLCFMESEFTREEEEGEGILVNRAFPPHLDYLLKRIAGELEFCVWITPEKAAYLDRYPLHFIAMESPMLSVGERIVLWKECSKGYDLDGAVDLVLCANQYILTAAGIREVLYTAEMERLSRGGDKISRDNLLSSVRQHASNQLGAYATRINAVFTWEDLIIDEEQKRQMKMICDHVKYRNVVGEEWGFHKKTPYGRGICAMFYGSPGTGKTMAVQVMANELGLDLYRIDLSQMVSKYIGETQKNISALFRRARNINALLFFDEADSLFAKRSEVRDSNDRNANADTAHLLQKLEDYGGITILATNYANNIDDAFKRRIKFMVNFVFPGQEVRYRLWTSILPDRVQCEEELDFEFFSKNFEMSGSNIKEVLTNAAYIAAAQGRGLMNRDVVEAIRINFSKYGKVLTQEDFGYLGF